MQWITNSQPKDARYFTQSGIEFWDDYEMTNQWHTIQTIGTNDYQAACVFSNYFVKFIFDGKTNKDELASTLLPLEKVPMRIIAHVQDLIFFYTNGIGIAPYIVVPTNWNYGNVPL